MVLPAGLVAFHRLVVAQWSARTGLRRGALRLTSPPAQHLPNRLGPDCFD